MKKSFVIFLFLLGIGLIGWVGYDYSTSGREVAQFDLSGAAGSTALVDLDPSMNPMRALLTVTYEIELLKGDTKVFDYSVILNGPGGIEVFKAEGQQRDKREDNTPEYATKTSDQVIKTFDIPAPGAYLLDWRIIPAEAKITVQTLKIRQNVRPLQIPYLIAGAVCFGLGFLLLVRRRQRLS